MEDSELYIYKLKGWLAESCLKRNNKIYLGKRSYYQHPLRYKLIGVKKWKKRI